MAYSFESPFHSSGNAASYPQEDMSWHFMYYSFPKFSLRLLEIALQVSAVLWLGVWRVI